MDVADLKVKFSADGEEGVIRATDRVNRGLDSVGDHARRAGSALDSVWKITGGFLLAKGIELAGQYAFGFAGGLLSMHANAEQAMMSLETVTGSAERAGALFKELQSFAASTPFEFPELAQASINLEAFGMKTMDWLPTIGDTASAMSKSVDQVVQAVLDASTGQYERLKELGILARVEGDKLQLQYQKNGQTIVEEVDKNNQELIQSTIKSIWNEKYSGAMEKQSQTFAGRWSTLKDNISMTLMGLTDGIFQFASTGLGIINSVFANGFYDTFENILSPTTIDFIKDIQSVGEAIVKAFGRGSSTEQILNMIPDKWRAWVRPILDVADAVGDLVHEFQSGGFRGLLQALPGELEQVGRAYLELGTIISVNVAASLRKVDWNTIITADMFNIGSAIGAALRNADWNTIIFGIRDGIMGALKGAGQLFIGLNTAVASLIGGAISGLVLGENVDFGTVVTKIRDGVINAIAVAGSWEDMLSAKGTELMVGLWVAAQTKWEEIGYWLSGIDDAAFNAIGELGETLLDRGTQLILGLKNGAQTEFDNVLTWVEGIGDEVWNAAASFDPLSLLYSIGIDIVQGMANGIAGAAGLVANAVNAIINSIPEQIRALMGLRSPSKVMRDLMLGVPQGMALGIMDGQKLVSNAMGDLMGTTMPGVTMSHRVSAPGLAPSRIASASVRGVNSYIFNGSIVGGDIDRYVNEKVANGSAKRVDRRITSRALEGARS